MDFIKGNVHLLLLFSDVLIGLGVLLLRWMYAFHYFTLERCDFKEARKRSAALRGKNKRKNFVALVVVVVAWPFCFVLCFCHVEGRACGILRRGVFEAEISGNRIGICGMGLSLRFPFLSCRHLARR